MTDWSLRLARKGDAEFLPAVELSASELFQSDAELAEVVGRHNGAVEEYRTLIGKRQCLVALSGDAIVGFLACEGIRRELHIIEVSVHADYQRKGIGSGLVRAAMIDARNCGFTALTLTTFRDIAWNGPFYGRLGFVEIDDLAVHPRLAGQLANEVRHGLPAARRCAMIYFTG